MLAASGWSKTPKTPHSSWKWSSSSAATDGARNARRGASPDSDGLGIEHDEAALAVGHSATWNLTAPAPADQRRSPRDRGQPWILPR